MLDDLSVQLILGALVLLAVLHIIEALLKPSKGPRAAASGPAAADYGTKWPAYGGGGLPHEATPSTDTGSWFELAEGVFKLRSATYLKDKVKQPAAPPVFDVVSITLIDCDESMVDVCRRLLPLRGWLAARPKESFFVTNRAVPIGGGMCRNVVTVAKRREPPVFNDAAFDRAWSRFKEADAKYRDLHLKYLPQLAKAPRAVESVITMLGGQRPVIMGKGYLAQQHSTGANYVEVDTDIQTSLVAKKIAGQFIGYCAALTIDEAFIIEAKREDELPERLLYQVQFRHVDTEKAARPLRAEDYVGADGKPRPLKAAANGGLTPPPPGFAHCKEGGFVRIKE